MKEKTLKKLPPLRRVMLPEKIEKLSFDLFHKNFLYRIAITICCRTCLLLEKNILIPISHQDKR